MDTGERDPARDSAASSGRTAAIEAAFAGVSGVDFGDDAMPSAGAERPVESPVSDEKPESASTETEAKPTVDDPARPVEGQPVTPVPTSTLDAPKHWPADRRAEFQTLPDGAKRIILDRNKEANVAVTKAQQEAAQFRRTSEAVASAFSDDHKQQMRNAGMDEIGAIQYLVKQHDALNNDPVGFLKAVIAQVGVKPEQLFGPQAVQSPGATPQPEAVEEWKDPAVVALEQRYQQLEQWKAAQEAERKQAQQTESQRFQSWFTEQCNAFENAIDDEGLPRYSHLNTVMNDVVRLVQSDPVLKQQLLKEPHKALEQAYNQALYLNTDIRQQLTDAEIDRRWAEREKASSVQKAQAAATRKGSPGANGQAKARTNLSRDEAINKAMADFGL